MVDNQAQLQIGVYRCQICDASAIHSNYGAITCAPCKMFFKRNASFPRKKLRCDFEDRCQINILNRRLCPSCRLQKCFLNGMQIELIRGPTFKKNRKRNPQTTNNSHKISTSTLLEIFTFDQNNDRYYQQLIQLAEQYVCQQTLLPVKFRFKLSSIQTFLSTIFLEIGRLFINNRHFHSFDLNDRLYFLKYQFKYILVFSSSIILHQSHLCDYQAFQQSIELLFDRMIFHRNHLFHIDIIYRKLSLQMISFCLLNFDYSSDNIRNRIYLKRMFNFYIELLSKYLLDVYDEKQQIKYLLNFNRCLFQLIDDVIRLETKQTFFDLINFVIQDIENKLIR